MTYILGIQKPNQGFSALISDLMVTQKDLVTGTIAKDTTVLKTGLLFPGCIYGLAGDATSGKDFILDISPYRKIGEIGVKSLLGKLGSSLCLTLVSD